MYIFICINEPLCKGKIVDTIFSFVTFTEGQIPKGAIYISEQSSVNGGVKTTDTYYAMPAKEEITDSQIVERKPKKYDGIGPIDEKGMPLAFRMVWRVLFIFKLFTG